MVSPTSEALRVALIVEGPTDEVVIAAALDAILDDDLDFVVTRVQPQASDAFKGYGQYGGGWRGVLRKCGEIGARGGPRDAGLLANYDIIVVHLDGDVAEEREVALAQPCPPARATADALRTLVATKLTPRGPEAAVVIAVPMKEIEAWLLPIFRASEAAPECDLECVEKPSHQFLGGKPKLARRQDGDIKKIRTRYEKVAREIERGWPQARTLGEAARFEAELRAAVSAAR